MSQINTDAVLLASAARTATITTGYFSTFLTAAYVIVDCTVDPAAASVVPSLLMVNPANADEVELSAFTAVTAVSENVYWIGSGAVATESQIDIAKDVALPRLFKWKMTHADTDSITYSVSLIGIR